MIKQKRNVQHNAHGDDQAINPEQSSIDAQDFLTTERDGNRPFFTTPGDVTGSDQENK